MALEVTVLGLDGVDERRDRVDQVALDVLAQDQLLQGHRRRLGVAQQHLALVGQEAAGRDLAGQAHDAHGAPHAGNDGRDGLERPGGVRQRQDLLAAGGDQVVERALEHRQQPGHQRRLALLARSEGAVLVAQQHERGVALEALPHQPQDLVHEGGGFQPLQRQVADAEQDLHPALAPRQLLGEPGRQGHVPVPLLPIAADPGQQLLDLADRERLRQVVVGAVPQTEDGGIHRRVAGDEHDGRLRLLALDGAQEVEAREAGHLDVGDHQIERLRRDQRQRLLGRGRLTDGAAVGGERGHQEA